MIENNNDFVLTMEEMEETPEVPIEKREMPRIVGTLRAHIVQVPECIYKASGIVILGRRIKSVVFTTDLAIIRNCNADAVLAVYPFTPQQIIAESIIHASSIPVFAGVGGGLTTGLRSVMIARDCEANGAYGVVVNAPTKNETIQLISKAVDIPVIVTVVDENEDIEGRINAGVGILNVSAAAKTPAVVRKIREKYPNIPIIATGGPTEKSIKETIAAGANAISYTPPSTADIFAGIMERYREEAGNEGDVEKASAGDDALIKAMKFLL